MSSTGIDEVTVPRAETVDGPKGYPFPTAEEGLLSWEWAAERLAQARHFWLATVRPDGRPHVAPLWGVWIDNAMYFEGYPSTRWARNLAANAVASIHVEHGEEVVIAEGKASLERVELDLAAEIIANWTKKYGRLEPEPDTRDIYQFRPDSVRGWSNEMLGDGTRWRFA
jgi:hypothetical protein